MLEPGGLTGGGIAETASRVLGRAVTYQEAPVSSRVDAFPIADAHKDLYAELFDYFKSETFMEDPQPVIDQLDGFQPRTIDDFLRRAVRRELSQPLPQGAPASLEKAARRPPSRVSPEGPP